MGRIIIFHVVAGLTGLTGAVIGLFQAVDYFVNGDPINYWSFSPFLAIAVVFYAALIYTLVNKM